MREPYGIHRPDNSVVADDREPWVIVAGSFHAYGGMDRLNMELARYLLDRGHPVHLVTHHADPSLANRQGVTMHRAELPLGSFALGEWNLSRLGKAVATRVVERDSRARILVNGGNCPMSAMNWVHLVHRAWGPEDRHGPPWIVIKEFLSAALARRREAEAFGIATCLIANSERTRRDIINDGTIDPSRVRTVYPGTDSSWHPPTVEERQAARGELGLQLNEHATTFIGDLGYDGRKGFDVLLNAWRSLIHGGWNGRLLVAGKGRATPAFRDRARSFGVGASVHFLGRTSQIARLLMATDVLIAPARYEPYGMAVKEAVCRGVPTIITESHGIAEHFPETLRPLLLPAVPTAAAVVDKLQLWSRERMRWSRETELLALTLREHTWTDMARQIAGH